MDRDRIYRIARTLNLEGHSDGLHRRQRKVKSRRGTVVSPGPDYVWSMDAHCKLQLWGIEIYAAIDHYSRCIVWFYIGISARSAVSVLAQYLQTLSETGHMPKFLRTDHGTETTMAAQAHFELTEDLHSEDDPLSFADCFKYGTSKANQRIEMWWNFMTKANLASWRAFFEELSALGQYNSRVFHDRVAHLAIYMPLLRRGGIQFVDLWNTHSIRSQKERPHTIPGPPEALYRWPEAYGGGSNQGCKVPNTLPAQQARVAGFDLEEYLPPTVVAWCRARLAEHFPGTDGMIEDDCVDQIYITVDGQQVRLHYAAYLFLRTAIFNHQQAGAEPVLYESEKPLGAWNWQPHPEVQRYFDYQDILVNNVNHGIEDPALLAFVAGGI